MSLELSRQLLVFHTCLFDKSAKSLVRPFGQKITKGRRNGDIVNNLGPTKNYYSFLMR